MRSVRPLARHGGILAFFVLVSLLGTRSLWAGLDDPAIGAPPKGETAALVFEGIDQGETLVLEGPLARAQLVVSMEDASDRVDVTDRLTWETEPAGIVRVERGGLVLPLADGEAIVRGSLAAGVNASGHASPEARVELRARVSRFASPRPISFPQRIVPIFTKHGCNGGGCHGKSGGQNGFRLSLLGFYPEEDYEHLVKEARGRRVHVALPDRSLLLLKSTNAVPHGGGQRLDASSHEYDVLRRWLVEGMPWGDRDEPTVERIEVFPKIRRLEREAPQRLRVVAHRSDGSIEDVTRAATYESNDTEIAEVSADGVVIGREGAGEAAVMIRYQESVAVFRAVRPLGAEVKDLPPARTFIDELVFAKWKDLGIPPSESCDDRTFLRRVTIDIAGRLPTYEESVEFADDAAPEKRERLIDRLLASTDHAEYFANKWSAILKNQRPREQWMRGSYAFYGWLRDSFHQNRPYDEIVREILAASGEITETPAVAWYRASSTLEERVEDSAQLFLGLRIQCARCHHHPFEVWGQDDYYGYAAFFTRVRTKDNLDGRPEEPRIFHEPGRASARDPRTGRDVPPTPLGAEALELPPDRDPRHALVDWMADPSNPFFARSVVNRYWKHFFGRGLVEPEDDLRVTNPASHPELLDALAARFVESGFDLKALVRTITRSTVYGLSSIPNEHNARDKQAFSRFYPRRLHAEVLYDAIHSVTAAQARFDGLPPGTRAVELPDSATNNYFLTVFGRPMGESACECERSGDASLAQSLHLINSKDLLAKIGSGEGRAASLARADHPIDDSIRELYWRAFSRPPDAEEIGIAKAHIEGASDRKAAFEDILWALLNTKEFLFNH